MKIKKLLLFVAFAFAFQAPLTSHAITEIKLAILAPEGTTWHKVMTDWDKELRQQTSGRLGLKIYAGGVLGDEQDVIRKMRIGQVHAAGFTGLGLGIINPEVRVLELPMLANDYVEADAVRAVLGKKLEAGFDKKGFVLLGWAENGFVNIFSNQPITSRADMNGKKMWAWEGDPLVETLYKVFNIVPIPLPLTDVLTSLQTKLIDAVYTPPLGAIALQWFTQTKYITDLNLVDSTGGVLISKQILTSIPPADAAILKQTAQKYSKILIDRTRTDNKKAFNTLTSSGLKAVKVSPEEFASIASKCKEVWSALAGKLYPQSMLDEAIAAVEEVRSKKQ